MNSFQQSKRFNQLKERDVRDIDSDSLDPKFFLSQYVKSNFPQTVANPSKMQQEERVPLEENKVKLNKGMSSSNGIGFDRPQVN